MTAEHSYMCLNEDCGARGSIKDVSLNEKRKQPKWCPYCGGQL